MKRFYLPLVFFLLHTGAAISQVCTITHNYDIAAECKGITMTMQHDNTGKSFLYVASKEAGLKIYNDSAAPALVKHIPVASLNGLHVMSLSQTGNYLYLALGNHFGKAGQACGFAIIDVTDPAKANVVATWSDSKRKDGAGIVECVGNYLYLGAMAHGLLIFDVTDKKKPALVSSFIPDIKFPDPKPDPAKYNARGMAIRNDKVYLCYDAGGVRIIDVADKKKPAEIGRWSNPVMNGKPRAYNNIVVDDSLAYVTVDYCGLEVLNISVPSNIRQVSWWNPWKCEASAMNWFSSEGHANEIAFDKKNKLLFLSTGRGDLHVVNVAKPAAPVLCANYGGASNELGTWGVSLYGDKIYLSYICAFIPFKSNWTGVKILAYSYK